MTIAGFHRHAIKKTKIKTVVVYRATKRLKYFQGTQPVNKHMVRTNRTTRQRSRDP